MDSNRTLDIKGYEGLYAINSNGQIWSHPKIGSGGHKGIFRKLVENKNGYLYIMLWKNRKCKFCLVHRLVAQTFIPNPKKKKEVNHKDGNKCNNNILNLEWVTPSENMNHSYVSGINKRIGENHPNTKLTENMVNQIRLTQGITQREIAQNFGISQTSVSNIKNRRRWVHL